MTSYIQSMIVYYLNIQHYLIISLYLRNLPKNRGERPSEKCANSCWENGNLEHATI